MMDVYRPVPDGAKAGMFILMPEAGHFLHPAHRIPEEMVEVSPVRPLPFQYRRLVWVWGLLGRVTREAESGAARRETALFAMSDAEVRPADNTDIRAGLSRERRVQTHSHRGETVASLFGGTGKWAGVCPVRLPFERPDRGRWRSS